MAEDQYRAELVHALRMKRLNETLATIRADLVVIDRDIEAAKAQAKEHESCLAL